MSTSFDPNSQLYRDLRKECGESDELSKQLATTQQQIRDLRREESILLSRKFGADEAIGKKFTKLSEQQCKPFAEYMHATLPREMRDIVYERLLEDFPPVKVTDTAQNVQRLMYDWDMILCQRSNFVYLQERFVGGAFLEEIVQLIYKKATIEPNYIGKIPQYLKRDLFETKLVPAKHIQNIQFSIEDKFFTTQNNTQKAALLRALQKVEAIENKECQVYFKVTRGRKKPSLPVFMEAQVLGMRDLGFDIMMQFGQRLFPLAFTAPNGIA